MKTPIPKNVELRDLRYFEVIATLGHVGQAAKVLFRTQPALTLCIRRLEEAFETTLFKRVGRRIQLTPVGQVLLARARLLHRATDEAFQEVDEFARGAAGHIRIGSGPISAEFVLPDICSHLLRYAKEITWEVVIASSDDLRVLVREGKLDLMIGSVLDGDPEFESRPIVADEVVVAAGRNHPIFKKRKIQFKDLQEYRWVLPGPNVPTRLWLDNLFTRHRMPPPKVQIEANSISSLIPVIAKSELLAFISRRQLDQAHSGEHLREVPIKGSSMHRRFGVSYRPDAYISPAVRRVLEIIGKSR